jgi:hypothetical protein
METSLLSASPSATGAAVTGAFGIDASRGCRDMSVSSQWWARPDDQRFLSLDALAESVRARKQNAHETLIEASDIIVHAEGAMTC